MRPFIRNMGLVAVAGSVVVVSALAFAGHDDDDHGRYKHRQKHHMVKAENLAALKVSLNLNSEQLPLWDIYASPTRPTSQDPSVDRAAMREQMEALEPMEHLQFVKEKHTDRHNKLMAHYDATERLYESLDPQQKITFNEALSKKNRHGKHHRRDKAHDDD